MKPAAFEYHAAHSADEAVELLRGLGDEAKLLAGGQSLIPMMNFRLAQPRYLIDINPVTELDFVRVEQTRLVIGAGVRTARLESAPEIREASPLVAAAAGLVGHPAIRHRGTIGGSIAHGDPAAELPTVAIALDAEIVLRSSGGRRSVPASEFLVGPFMTVLKPDELITEVRIPKLPAGSGSSFLEFSRRHGDLAVVGTAVMVTVSAGRVSRASVALCGVSGTPVRAVEVEEVLLDAVPSGSLATAAAKRAAAGLDPAGDIHATPEFRKQLAQVYVERALLRAFTDAGVRL